LYILENLDSSFLRIEKLLNPNWKDWHTRWWEKYLKSKMNKKLISILLVCLLLSEAVSAEKKNR
jgi:hypothetical protein